MATFTVELSDDVLGTTERGIIFFSVLFLTFTVSLTSLFPLKSAYINSDVQDSSKSERS